MSNTRTFIVTADCDAYCRERWRVTIPADTPDEELRGALHEALDATGDFLDQDVDGEHNREITGYEEERVSAPDPFPDHAARAKRATEIIDGESHVRHIEDWRPVKYTDAGQRTREPAVVLPDSEQEVAELRDANPLVEFQFLSTAYDGTDCWIGFHESLEEAADYLASEAQADVPWAPGEIYDLDADQRYETTVTVTTRATRVIA